MLNDEELCPLEDALQRLREAFADEVSSYPRDNSLLRSTGGPPSAGPRRRPGVRPTKTQLQVELKRVDAALDRIQAGTFGVCCRCKMEIEMERLTEDPAAPFCRPCFDELSTERQKKRR